MDKFRIIVQLVIAAFIIATPGITGDNHHPEAAIRLKEQNRDAGNKNLYIVFLSGLGCHCDGSRFNNMGFEHIRRQLAHSGYSYNDRRFLLYSYNGGRIDGREWHPGRYGPRDTWQSIALSLLRLDDMIEQFSSTHPQARYVLIGHSLGGRIALDYASSAEASHKKRIIGVITMNAPLLGAAGKIPGLVLLLPENWNIALAGAAVKQLVWEYNISSELRYLRQKQIEELEASGIKVATFSTRQDVVVPFEAGCLMDEKRQPLTGGFVVDAERFSLKDISGHMQILKREEVLSFINSLCGGRGD